MNRMEEYQAMLEALEQSAPGLDTTLERAYAKKRKRTRQRILRPVAGLAACFVLFVLLVNFSAPVAYACARIPGLRELAEAVTFSRSLTDAVDNAYVQPMELSQTSNGITAEVDYLIVDQKQVNVFYRLNSEKYPQLTADPEVFDRDGNRPSCGYHSNDFNAENGELRCLTIDFVDNNVPDCLKIRLHVDSFDVVSEAVPPEHPADIFEDAPEEERNYLASFEFLLEFDPQFTAAGKIFPVNQTVTLDGQDITITKIEVYPTHLRVDVREEDGNSAWLQDLEFYIETDWGMKFEPASSGITATGSVDSPAMVSYRADSTIFTRRSI